REPPAAARVGAVRADVQVDLDRRGRAHHGHPGVAEAAGAEVLAHAGVAGVGGLGARAADGVDAVAGEGEPFRGEGVAHVRDVPAERGVELAEPAEGRGAELQLPARLVADGAAAGRRAGRAD